MSASIQSAAHSIQPISDCPADNQEAGVSAEDTGAICEQPRQLTASEQTYTVIVSMKSRHPFFSSPCYSSTCVPGLVFGSLLAPFIETASDSVFAVAAAKFLGGAAAGGVIATTVGFAAYKVYNRIYPPQDFKITAQEFKVKIA